MPSHMCRKWKNNKMRVSPSVDGANIAMEDLNKYKASKFYDISYPIPQELTTGKQTVVVKFLPKKK